MTVSYNFDVSSNSSANFLKLLLRWKGSIWKSVLSELLIWCVAYLLVAIVYHGCMMPNQQEVFNTLAIQCDDVSKYIPITFMLAFFVSIIVTRWKTTFANMGWIESCALSINSQITSRTEEARLIRRNIIRYLVLAQILTFRDISIRVRRRFPNIDSISKAGFITDEEEEKLESIDLDQSYNKYWVPINWAIILIVRADEKKYCLNAPGTASLINEIKAFRSNLATICNFDWVPVPIAYPQVIFFAVRMFFVICLISRQHLIGKVTKDDKTWTVEWNYAILFIKPVLTIIQFICFVGWLKVAEALLNPLGEDDDDFESNFLIDKNIFTGIKICDEFDECPPMFFDNFSDPNAAPIYSIDSQNHTNGALIGSVSNITLAQNDDNVTMIPLGPRASIGDSLSMGLDRTSTRHRSRPESFKKSQKVKRHLSEGAQNDGYEYDMDPPCSPSSHKFSTSLAKVDENEEEEKIPDAISRV